MLNLFPHKCSGCCCCCLYYYRCYYYYVAAAFTAQFTTIDSKWQASVHIGQLTGHSLYVGGVRLIAALRAQRVAVVVVAASMRY